MNQIAYEDFSLFVSALKFGAHKHRWQRRKDAEQTPYFNHPINVAEILWGIGGVRDITILSAAPLHDVIEDTETLPEEVERDFGKVVRSLILEVTDDKSLAKETRKELQVQHAPHLSPGAKLIKIADKICNIKDVVYSPPPTWSIERRLEYLAWAERVVKAMNGCNERLEEEFYRLLKEGRERLSGSRRKLT
jgi:(p)ppGpp synthase/HD superfamily hydrolase